MSGNDRSRPDRGGSENQAAAKLLDASILSRAADIAYVVVVVSPYGQPRRRPYLSLHHATAAVQRTEAKGQPARLVLCKLEPVTAGLDVDDEVTE